MLLRSHPSRGAGRGSGEVTASSSTSPLKNASERGRRLFAPSGSDLCSRRCRPSSWRPRPRPRQGCTGRRTSAESPPSRPLCLGRGHAVSGRRPAETLGAPRPQPAHGRRIRIPRGSQAAQGCPVAPAGDSTRSISRDTPVVSTARARHDGRGLGGCSDNRWSERENGLSG
jgi:hypothetical protein